MDYAEYPGFSLEDEVDASIEQYVFSQSFLMEAVYDPLTASLDLIIDAYISIEHPGMCGIMNDPADSDCSKYYRRIQASLSGVQYFESIRASSHGRIVSAVQDPIEVFDLLEIGSYEPSILYDHDSRRLSMALNINGHGTAIFADICEALDYVFFKTSSLAFLAGYAELKITEIEEEWE